MARHGRSSPRPVAGEPAVIASGAKQSTPSLLFYGLLRCARNDAVLIAHTAPRSRGEPFVVVPAKAGTHTPRPRGLARWLTVFAPRKTCGYGSPRARGRRT